MKFQVIFLLLIYNSTVHGQERNWTHAKSKDGTVNVKYEVTENDSKETLVFYEAQTIFTGSIANYKDLMSNSSRYQEFLEYTEESKEIERFSASEWLMYLYFDQPWPLPNSDCVHRVFLNDTLSNGFNIVATNDIDAFPMQNVKRMEVYDVTYTFVEQQDKIEFTIKAKFTPVGSLPKWMLTSWFPEGPAGIMRRIIENGK
ncbi:MAG: hypothetical protein NXI20_24250 [bacterium]|nr:hypothetical protein [bacterium]